MNISNIADRPVLHMTESVKIRIKTVFYILAVIAVAVSSQLAVNYMFHDEGKMLDAFAATDANVIKSSFTVVGDFGSKYMTKEDKEKLIDFVSAKLGITEPLEKTTTNGNVTECMAAGISGRETSTKIESISVDQANAEGVVETNEYLYVTIEIYENTDSILHYKNIVEKALEEANVKELDSSVILQGSYDQKLSVSEKDKIVKNLLASMQGKVVLEERGEKLYSIYANTPMIKNTIKVNEKRANINIAFSYDEEKNQTLLYVATPLINESY